MRIEKLKTQTTTNNNLIEKVEDVADVTSEKSCENVQTDATNSPNSSLVHETDESLQKPFSEDACKSDEIEPLADKIIDFFNSEPDETIDITIVKLEMIRDMFENTLGEGNVPQLDELVETAKKTKAFIDESKKGSEDNEEDHSYESYFHEDLPRHYYGEEDEIIFEDPDECGSMYNGGN